MKKPIALLLFCLLNIAVYSQKNYNISGVVTDTLNDPLIYATVLLLEKSDSTMIEFARTELDGSFKFKDVKPGQHIVKTTYIGYIPNTIDASSTDGSNVQLGQIKMSELAEELMTVVIKAAKAPIKMRGDTIEYDATTFKVPEGSTVEDLLKRLPGIEVESDGSISSDGKDVNRVTVDGKSFFGSDPKAATKNLPAEGISKVQVFDTKTEAEKITGSTGEAEEKTMNLELKEEFKKGGFGKVIAGVGTEQRAELKGNYNKFNKKVQFSLVGVGNNTGRNGLSWDDYQDFMGSQSFNFGGGTDYGFPGGGGFHTYYFGGGGGGLESSIQSIFFSGAQNGGLPENYNGGVNFNYDDSKDRLSTVYYYNQSGLVKNGTSSRDRFYQGFSTSEISDNLNDDLSKGHRAEVDYEREIDSLHSIQFTANAAFITDNRYSEESSSVNRGESLANRAETVNNVDTRGQLLNGLLIFRKKFQKKGRNLGLNTSILYTELEDDWTQFSQTDFFSNSNVLDSTAIINQANNNVRDKIHFKANALFVEPLNKKLFSQTFYNYSNRLETGERRINDLASGNEVVNDDLSRTYENTIGMHRIGSSIRYSFNEINISAGAGYQIFDLDGIFQGTGNSNISGIVDKTFINWIPHLTLNYDGISNGFVSIGYTRTAQEPTIEDLQPIVNNLNPQYIIEGNPALTPELSNKFNINFRKSYPLSGVRFNLRANYDLFVNQFSTSESVDEFLITSAQPINVDGGTRLNINGGFNFPIIKNKITTRIRMTAVQSIKPSLVNEVLNNTSSWSYRPYIRFNITPVENIGLYISANLNFTDTRYDINESQNQKIRNENYSVELTAKTFLGVYLNANLQYDRYVNQRFNINREIPILNCSIYKQVLKDNKGEIRLSIYDSFNKNVGFTSSDSFRAENNALGRYVMASFTYNIRGIKASAHKKSWW